MSARLSYLVREAANVTGQVVNTASTLGSAKRLALALASGNTLSLSQTTSAGVRRANTSVEILAFSGVLPPNAGGLDPAGEPEQSDQVTARVAASNGESATASPVTISLAGAQSSFGSPADPDALQPAPAAPSTSASTASARTASSAAATQTTSAAAGDPSDPHGPLGQESGSHPALIGGLLVGIVGCCILIALVLVYARRRAKGAAGMQLEPPDVFKDSGPASGKMIDLEKAPEPALSTLPRPVRSQPASPRRSILSWKWGPETGAGSNRFSVIKSP
ncbi:hypothetical protein HK105_201444 [Polyrhizophydium stewartii]|uniref:Uncharacterized protein n=1 Tax=Polyrhizophydium stewartii TaxID=2732419 RepID=A0ABR4NI80_9FUNG